MDSGSESDDNTWDDWSEGAANVKSLFDDEMFSSVESALRHDKEVHGVDIRSIVKRLDDFERIKMINWMRKNKTSSQEIKKLNVSDFSDDQYLKPVLEEDPLLQYDWDEDIVDEEPQMSLEDQLRVQLNDALAGLEAAKRRLAELSDIKDVTGDEPPTEKPKRDDDTHYFESYAHNEIHEIMLSDKVRTETYRDFLLSSGKIIANPKVMDVGCGTGILSLFAVQGGASQVYAVDASDIAKKALANVQENKISNIKVINNKVEDISLADDEKVDILVSEWMGYFLLYESMFDSVISARDRFLKPDGIMAPSQCSIMWMLADVSPWIEKQFAFWDNVYGYKMSSMKSLQTKEAYVLEVDPELPVSQATSLKDLMTKTATVDDVSFTSDFSLTSSRDAQVNAFVGYFDTFFTADGRHVTAGGSGERPSAVAENEQFFTTSPLHTQTHWKQTLFLFDEPLPVKAGDIVKGTFSCTKNPDNSRELLVTVTFGVSDERRTQVWLVR